MNRANWQALFKNNQDLPAGHFAGGIGGYFLKVFTTYLLGMSQANCFITHKKLTMYPLGKLPFTPSVPPSSDIPEQHREHVCTPVPFGGFWGSPGQHTPNVTLQDTRQMPHLGSGTTSRVFEDGHCWDGIDETCSSNDENCNPRMVTHLCREVASMFCRYRTCRYWHTDPRQVKRHRDTHFEHRYGFVCPSQATCPSQGGNFRRRDAVGAHCKRFLLCGDALKAGGGLIWLRGVPATEEDLQPYDPKFHIPYERFDGRTGRGSRKVAEV